MGPKRSYNKASPDSIDSALVAIRTRGLSIRDAAKEFGVCKSTLHDKLTNRHPRRIGRPVELDREVEKKLVNLLNEVAEWGYPVGGIEIKLMVKNILDEAGLTSSMFRDNRPGDKWLHSFIARNRISQRVATNIKRARASLSADTINSFFDKVEPALSNVDPRNVFNFDETNLADNPGSKKVCRPSLLSSV